MVILHQCDSEVTPQKKIIFCLHLKIWTANLLKGEILQTQSFSSKFTRCKPSMNDSVAPVKEGDLAVCSPGDTVKHQSIALSKQQRFYYL